MVYAYNGLLFSFQKEGNSHICYDMSEHQGIMLGEIGQQQKDKYCVIPITYGTESSQNIHRK
jgi:hypothetical protein